MNKNLSNRFIINRGFRSINKKKYYYNYSRILCCSSFFQFYKSTGVMNVSTVFPEGVGETERSQRHASASVKDDEDVQDRFNREH